MRFALLLAATTAVPAAAAAACFDTFVYTDARELLGTLPSDRERAALQDRELAASYDRTDDALVAFLDTERDTVCSEAEAARVAVNTAVDDLVARGGLEAGYCCTSWNTGTGGTNCTATSATACENGLFYCEKQSDGSCF